MLRVPQTTSSLPRSGPPSASSENSAHEKRNSNGTGTGSSRDASSRDSSRLPSSRHPSSQSSSSTEPSSRNPSSHQASSRHPSSQAKVSKDVSSRDRVSRDSLSRDKVSRDPASRDKVRQAGVRFAEVPKPILAVRSDRLSVGTLRATVKFLGKSKRPKLKPKPKPRPPEGFVACKVEGWIKDILEDRFNDYKYTAESAGEDAKHTSTLILDAAKSRDMGRYKFVCYVALGDDSQQGLEVATRWLWDTTRDDYACVTHLTKDFYVVAILHAVYFE